MNNTTKQKHRKSTDEMQGTFPNVEAASAYKTARMNEMLKKIKNIEVLTNSSFTKS